MAEEEDLVTEDEETEEGTDAEAGDSESDDPKKAETKASAEESTENKPTAKRGRPAKEPPPPKLWRLEGTSPEGMRVTLGRYVNKEEADPDLERLEEDGFYEKLKITKSKEE